MLLKIQHILTECERFSGPAATNDKAGTVVAGDGNKWWDKLKVPLSFCYRLKQTTQSSVIISNISNIR